MRSEIQIRSSDPNILSIIYPSSALHVKCTSSSYSERFDGKKTAKDGKCRAIRRETSVPKRLDSNSGYVSTLDVCWLDSYWQVPGTTGKERVHRIEKNP